MEQPIIEACIRSNLARALTLQKQQDQAFKEVCRAKDIIACFDQYGAHLREETIYHINTTYLMFILSKGQQHSNDVGKLSWAATAGVEAIYGQHEHLAIKYRPDLKDMINAKDFFACCP